MYRRMQACLWHPMCLHNANNGCQHLNYYFSASAALVVSCAALCEGCQWALPVKLDQAPDLMLFCQGSERAQQQRPSAVCVCSSDLPFLSMSLCVHNDRYYSISSSPLARPGTCSVSVGKVAFTTPTGRAHKGAASAMIAATPVGGKLLGCVRKLSSSFRLPKDPSVPVIMVGPGE